MTRSVDRTRSLEDLEGVRWPAPPPDATPLVTSVHALRRRPVGELTDWDLCRLIRQDVGVAHVLPLALEMLRADPPTDDDLLCTLMNTGPDLWRRWPDFADELAVIVQELTELPPYLVQPVASFLAAWAQPAAAATPPRRGTRRGAA